jgi:hypothetical protein
MARVKTLSLRLFIILGVCLFRRSPGGIIDLGFSKSHILCEKRIRPSVDTRITRTAASNDLNNARYEETEAAACELRLAASVID